MAFYDDMRGVATSLLTEFGTTVEFIDLAGTVLGTVVGIKSPVDIENMTQTVIQSSVATLYVSDIGFVPTLQHFVRMDGQEYVITHIQPVRPADATVMFKIYIGAGG